MPSEKVASILRSKTELTDDTIARLSDNEAWQIIYASIRPSPKSPKLPHVCFTGFPPAEKERLQLSASGAGLHVVTKVTRSLAMLITGPNAGPAKMKQASEIDAAVLTESQFTEFVRTGELPT